MSRQFTRSQGQRPSLTARMSLHSQDLQRLAHSTIIPHVLEHFELGRADPDKKAEELPPGCQKDMRKLACLVLANRVKKVVRSSCSARFFGRLKANLFIVKVETFLNRATIAIEKLGFAVIRNTKSKSLDFKLIFMMLMIVERAQVRQLASSYYKILYNAKADNQSLGESIANDIQLERDSQKTVKIIKHEDSRRPPQLHFPQAEDSSNPRARLQGPSPLKSDKLARYAKSPQVWSIKY